MSLNVNDAPSVPTFSDIQKNNYAFQYVEAAAKAGLIYGIGNGSFAGSSTLSRQDMATMYVRALGVDVSGYAQKLTFSDAGSISNYAKDAVGYLYEKGLINGLGNNVFNAKDNAIRQDVALVATKFLVAKEELTKENPTPKPELPPVITPEPEPTPEPQPEPEPEQQPEPTPEPELPPVVSPEPELPPVITPETEPTPEQEILTPPTSLSQTMTVGSLPHFRHSWDVNYGAAVTKVTLQHDGGNPTVFTVEGGGVQSSASDIVVMSHGTYLTPGNYVWTIEATGYLDEVVDVTVQPRELALFVNNPLTSSATINLPANFEGSTISWMIVQGSGGIYSPFVYTTQTRQPDNQSAILEATFNDNRKKYFTVIVPTEGNITVQPDPFFTLPELRILD